MPVPCSVFSEIPPWGLGSGKALIPCARMHREKASSLCLADPLAGAAPVPELGELEQAAARRARQASAAASSRACRGRARFLPECSSPWALLRYMSCSLPGAADRARAAVVRAGQLRKRFRAGWSSRAWRARFATADHVVIWLVRSETVLKPPAGHAGGARGRIRVLPPGSPEPALPPKQTGRARNSRGVPKGETVRVLVVEDHAEMAETVAVGLRRAQMAVDVALDGPSGLERALTAGYDVIVLDRDLPGIHGDQVCAELVAAGCRSRVLMLTAAAANEDLVDGLGLGADDYLPKPFDFPVLVARIGALARRAHPAVPPVLRHAELVVDTARRCAWRAGRPLELSPKEFGVLELLAAAQGRAVSAEELLERVWDEFADPFTTAVKITISRLRANLGDPPLIETVPKSGYRIGG